MPSIDTTISDNLTAKTVQVYTRASWLDAWTPRPELEVVRFSSHVAPSIGDAELVWKYGRIEGRTGTAGYTNVSRLALRRHFVKIVQQVHSGTPISWYGVIVTEVDQFVGRTSVSTGNQGFRALSMEWLLTRVRIASSKIQQGAAWVTIQRGLAFNAARGQDGDTQRLQYANRSVQFVPTPVGNRYVFHWSPVPGEIELWRAADIVEYLLYFFSPTPQIPTTDLDWVPSLSGLTALEHLRPINVDTHNRTVYEVLNQVIDRRFGLTWSMNLDATERIMILSVHPFVDVDLSLPSGGILPANQSVRNWVIDDHIEVEDCTIVTDTLPQYEHIVMEGARRGACCTFAYAGGTLLKGWTPQERTDYVNGDGAFGGEPAEDQARNDAARHNPAVRKVYTWHNLTPVLQFGTIPDWRGAGPPEFLAEALDLNGIGTGLPTPIFYSGVRVDQRVPLGLFQNQEYWQPIFAGLRTDTDADVWEFVHHMASTEDERKARNRGHFHCHTAPLHDSPSVEVAPATLAHVLGRNDFPANAAPSSQTPVFDYRELAVTGFVEVDDYVLAFGDDGLATPQNNQNSTLRIPLGNRARLDRVLPNTVVNIANGQPVLTQGGNIRDDRPWMRDLAVTAAYWSLFPHVALSVTLKQLTSQILLGEYITTFGSGGDLRSVDGIVSSIDWNHQNQTTTVRTDFGEFDPVAVIDAIIEPQV